ncbi:ATP-binding protein [Arcobacter sp. YIC-464]|uniref:ATP-binding protein n=1 Tax=Arcobacter sp. YIC-464 TaxID=3376631 RepID=UPI003C18CC77
MRIAFKYKIIIGIFIVELFFLSFIILYNYTSIQTFTKELVNKNIKTNEFLLKEMIKTPIIMYDLATLDNILEKFADLQNVNNVKIYDANNKLISKFKEQINPNIEFYKHVQFNIVEDDIKVGFAEVTFDLSEIYSQIDEHTKDIILIALIEIILSILISYLVGRKLSEHLTTLDNAVKNITISNTDIKKLDINSKDEFEDLANSFNIMQTRIQAEVEKNTKQHLLLLEQSRLASMGEMIGNIAHQWRQPLSIISSGATAIKLQKEFETLSDEELLRTCEMININAQYLSSTIDDFKEFVKNDRIKVNFKLEDAFNSFFKLIEGTVVHYEINLIKQIDSSIEMEGYPNELIQCFMNIFNNSKDAFKEISVIDKFVFVETFIKNDKVHIIFKDNAGGIPKDILPHVFEPYFTTKHKSQGTGIGLSMSYNLITVGMNGSISVENTEYIYDKIECRGACFEIIVDF